jgi:hypothetical protein
MIVDGKEGRKEGTTEMRGVLGYEEEWLSIDAPGAQSFLCILETSSGSNTA